MLEDLFTDLLLLFRFGTGLSVSLCSWTSLCGPEWPIIHYVAQAGLERHNFPASAFYMLGFWEFVIVPDFAQM